MSNLKPSLHHELQTREAGVEDDDKLFNLFVACRSDLLAAITNLDEAQQEAFMRIQFQAQREQYRNQFAGAQWEVIIRQGEIIGQIMVAAIDDELRLIDVSLLPEFRNQGIGNALLRDLLEKAADEKKRVSLHVLQDNPAARLYQRLGFNDVGQQGVYRRMEWEPASGAPTGTEAKPPASVS